MDFFEIMLNLLVGTVGGVFSSVIVSRVFMIVSDYSEQIARVQTRVEVSYCLQGALWAASMQYKDGSTELGCKYKEELERQLAEERKYYAQMIFDDLEEELHNIAIEFSDFVIDLTVENLDKNVIEIKCQQLDVLTNKFNKYRNLRKKKMFKLFCKDITLRMLLVAFVIIIALTVIA